MLKRKLAQQWEALDAALSIIFNEDVKGTILDYFELKHQTSKEKKEKFGQEEIERLLLEMLGNGGNLIVTEFRKKLVELHAVA